MNVTGGADKTSIITMESGARIDTSATQDGNGGTVGIVGATNLAGDIVSKGAGVGNKGGNAVVYSANLINYNANADLSGKDGAKGGTLALIGKGTPVFEQLITKTGVLGIQADALTKSLDNGTNVQSESDGLRFDLSQPNTNNYSMDWAGDGSLYLKTDGDIRFNPVVKPSSPQLTSNGTGSIALHALGDIRLVGGVSGVVFKTNSGALDVAADEIRDIAFLSTSGDINVTADRIDQGGIQSNSGNINLDYNYRYSSIPTSISSGTGIITAKIGSDIHNALTTMTAANGLNLWLKDGTYTGNFGINKDNVTVRSINGADKAKINGGFYVTGNNVRISELGINSNGGVGIAYIDAANGTVANNTITGAALGVLGRKADNLIASGNTINSTSGTAIGLSDSDGVLIHSNTINGAATGIDLFNGQGTVSNNSVNGTSGIAIAIRAGTRNTDVNANSVTNTKDGIILNAASSNLIRNNRVDTTNGDGIAAFNTGIGAVGIMDNTLVNVRNGTGIALNTATGSLIKGNTLNNVSGTVGRNGAAISIVNSAGTTISENSMQTVTGNGIEVMSSNDSKVLRNRLRAIGQNPIVTVESTNVEISDNDI